MVLKRLAEALEDRDAIRAVIRGFGRSVNEGVHRTRSELVLVLTSDVRAEDDFLSPLVAAMGRDPTLVAVSPAGRRLTAESHVRKFDMGSRWRARRLLAMRRLLTLGTIAARRIPMALSP